MYVVVLFLLLWTLFQHNLCEAKCEVTNPDQSILYILETNDVVHKRYNEKFKSKLMKALGWGVNYPLTSSPITLNNCSTNLMETMEDTKNLRYVINLYVGDFYQTNYNVVKNYNLRWVGDIGMSKFVNVCKSDMRTRKGDMETCNFSSEPRKHAKLASEEVLDIPFLFDFVNDFPQRTTKFITHEIAICTKECKDWSKYDASLYFYDVHTEILLLGSESKICNPKFSIIPPAKDNVIAVLAPNPECVPETNKPVIFYEEPFFRPEAISFYRNSIMRTRSWKQMTHSFLLFIWKMKWNRVAIVSDDSVESEEFERELRLLFNENELIYTVETAGETSKCCDFNKALASLKKADARIIIANVDKQRASLLAQQAKDHGLNYQYHMWIARDWSEDTAVGAAKMLYKVVSISPKRTPIEMYLEAIRGVIYDKRKESYDFLNQTQFTRDIRRNLRPMDTTQIDITLTTNNGNHRIIASYKNRAGTYYEPNLSMPSDRNGECIFKSRNYYKPCDDLNFIIFMLVVAVFAVTVLGITYFFDTPDTPYNRMAN